MKGLEPTRLPAPDPKSGASTNIATSAVKKEPLKLLLPSLRFHAGYSILKLRAGFEGAKIDEFSNFVNEFIHLVYF